MTNEFMRTLPVKLNPDEVAEKSAELVTDMYEMGIAKEDADNAKRKIAEDLKMRDVRIVWLARCVRERSEPREVDCHEEIDLSTGTARTIRDDTGDFVDSRALTEFEIRDARQAELPNISLAKRAKRAKA